VNFLEMVKDAWSSTLTNFRKYWDEFRHLWYAMKSDHLPRFKNGSFDPREKENYLHLIRNLLTETFRAMPRTLSGLFIIWLLLKLI
jgi:hypothetical protein